VATARVDLVFLGLLAALLPIF